MRHLLFLSLAVALTACDNPQSLEGTELGGLAQDAQAGQIGPEAPSAEIVVAASVVDQANARREACSASFTSYRESMRQAEAASHNAGPQAQADLASAQAQMSVALAEGARNALDVQKFMADHPEATELVQLIPFMGVQIPSDFLPCFAGPSSASQPTNTPSASSASASTTANVAPQPIGPTVHN